MMKSLFLTSLISGVLMCLPAASEIDHDADTKPHFCAPSVVEVRALD
ncbi:hypothetical protein TRM7557_03194 [Tritonibacter multivorans]|uniref:Uncharacterized protein n=1 Tax=Tritonibacter multivorans TaxID=928856 RepID=A0A0P1H0B8_9RHOB|nr:hypothetical protein [Tritonibacter multivorans]MDA7420744.1 hypothetical protein [Tritonibacter multivorans]CUH81038.1 hypothetical protein TRM7557_03194 [Tritonibacter multivorans]SFC26177.1 hypothetical protein SAMN04488049_10230 [Tritonibacter multivorans]